MIVEFVKSWICFTLLIICTSCTLLQLPLKKPKPHNNNQEIEQNLNRAQFAFDSNHWGKSFLYLDIVLYDLDLVEKQLDSLSVEKKQEIESQRYRVYKMLDSLYKTEIKKRVDDSIVLTKRFLKKWITRILSRENLSSYSLPIPNPVPENVIRNMVRFLTTDRKVFSIWLERFFYYQNYIKQQLKEHDLPKDLIYVAMIESGFNFKAYSSAKAVGLWQFIGPTARIFDLKYNWWLDERRDPAKATKAALKYLTYLYKQFKSWDLALAAYNGGEGRVRSQLRRRGRNYWTMKLPKETQNYVARILAAMIIGNNPEKYAFYPSRELESVFGDYDTVTVFHTMDLKFVAENTGSKYKYIQKLNSELKRWTTPPSMQSYLLKIPLGTRSLFLERYLAEDTTKFVKWARHQIKEGETLGHIALHYGVPISVIVDANKIKSNIIVAGRHLLVPRTSFHNE